MKQKANLALQDLFASALELVTAQRQEVNALDGYNGNHGDNMVENLRLITQALETKRAQSPTEALHYAGQQLNVRGRGGTSRYYAQGLEQAATRLQGHAALDQNDVLTLVQTLMETIPAQRQQQPAQPAESVLDMLGQLSGGKQDDDGLDLQDVVQTLLPVGMALLQSRQTKTDPSGGAVPLLMRALLGGQTNPLQAPNARSAAGGLVMQGLLRALTGR